MVQAMALQSRKSWREKPSAERIGARALSVKQESHGGFLLGKIYDSFSSGGGSWVEPIRTIFGIAYLTTFRPGIRAVMPLGGLASARAARSSLQHVAKTGSAAPKRQGRSPGGGKLAPHLMQLIRWVEAKPDISMPELSAKLEAETRVVAHPAS